jgi:hypothetical protein
LSNQLPLIEACALRHEASRDRDDHRKTLLNWQISECCANVTAIEAVTCTCAADNISLTVSCVAISSPSALLIATAVAGV